MKEIKSRSDLLGKILLPMALILCTGYITLTVHLQKAFYLNWLNAAACIVLIILPKSSTRLCSEPIEYFMFIKIAKTWLIQILTLLSFITFCHLLIDVPLTNNPHPHLNTLGLMNRCLTHYGLFPWTSYAITSIALAFFAYRKKVAAEFACITHLRHTTTHDSLGIILNTGLRNTSYITLAVSLLTITLLFCNIFYQGIVSLQAGWSLPPLVLILVCCVILIVTLKGKVFHTPFCKKLSLFTFILVLSVSLAIFFGLLYGLASMISPSHWQTPPILASIRTMPWHAVSQLACLLWWLGWLPLMSLFLAKQCHGLSIRNSVIMLLSLPLTVSLYLYNFANIKTFNTVFNTSHSALWVGFVALIVLLFLFTSKRNRYCLMNHHLPPANQKKYRPFTQALESVTVYLLISLIMYLLGGCYFTNFFLVALVFPGICYTPLLVWGQCQHSIRKKINTMT